MRRREFLASLGAVTSAWPLAARAQEPGKVFRIGMAEPVSAELNAAYLAAFRQELKRLGYVEERNLVIGGGNEGQIKIVRGGRDCTRLGRLMKYRSNLTLTV